MVPPREPVALIQALERELVEEAEPGDVAGVEERTAVEREGRSGWTSSVVGLAVAEVRFDLLPRLIRAQSSVQAIPSDEMVFGKPVERRALAQRRLPARLGRREFGLARLGLPLQVFQPGLERVELFPLARVGVLIIGGELPSLIARPFSGTLLKKAKNL